MEEVRVCGFRDEWNARKLIVLPCSDGNALNLKSD